MKSNLLKYRSLSHQENTADSRQAYVYVYLRVQMYRRRYGIHPRRIRIVSLRYRLPRAQRAIFQRGMTHCVPCRGGANSRLRSDSVCCCRRRRRRSASSRSRADDLSFPNREESDTMEAIPFDATPREGLVEEATLNHS